MSATFIALSHIAENHCKSLQLLVELSSILPNHLVPSLSSPNHSAMEALELQSLLGPSGNQPGKLPA